MLPVVAGNPLNVIVGNPGLPARAPPVIEYTSVAILELVDPLFAVVWIGAINVPDEGQLVYVLRSRVIDDPSLILIGGTAPRPTLV